MRRSYLNTWCFGIIKYFFFEQSNFAISIRVCFRSSFPDRSCGSGERSYCSLAFSFAGEAKHSSVKSWSSLAVRDFVNFARSWNKGSFSLAGGWRGFFNSESLGGWFSFAYNIQMLTRSYFSLYGDWVRSAGNLLHLVRDLLSSSG